MGLKKQLVFIGLVMMIASLACQGSTQLVSSLVAEPTESAPVVNESPTSTAVEESLYAKKLPPNFLSDPNTACAYHYGNDLSCLDKDGWHVYTTFDYDSFPEEMAQCSDGRNYLKMGNWLYSLEGETLDQLFGLWGSQFLVCGSGKEIWVNNEGRHLSLFDGAAWSEIPLTEVFDDSVSIDSMVVAPNGSLWVEASGYGIANFDGTSWQVFQAGKDFEEPDKIYKMVVDLNGIVWAVGSAVLKYDGIRWSTFPIPEDIDDFLYTNIDQENRVWVGTFRGKIYTIDIPTNGSELQFDEQASLGRVILDMQRDSQDRLWVATSYGLNVYDGSAWVTYRIDNADLYDNSAHKIVILGDGPQLPDPAPKAPGTVKGKLDYPDPAMYANKQVEICLDARFIRYLEGPTPCYDQAYHVLTTVDADGNFMFTDIRAGTYYLMVQDPSGNWWSSKEEFEVKPGETVDLSEIPPE